MYRFALVFLLLVEPAVADTIYKCVEGGKTTYSSSPCSGKPAKELYYSQPTPQERAQSQAASAALNAELQRREEWMRIQRQAGAMTAQSAAPSINAQPQFDPSMNEKVMVHTPNGWDYKTRAQIIAEEQAKAARAAGRRQSPVTAPATTLDQYGNTWLNQGGTAFNPATGRRCDQVGGQLVNCR
jgi:hypothetical protein